MFKNIIIKLFKLKLIEQKLMLDFSSASKIKNHFQILI